MPIIRIDFDSDKVTEEDMQKLSIASHKIVTEVTGIEDVFVYANSSQIKMNVAPVEIFVEMSAHKIKDADTLIEEIKTRLLIWKKEATFKNPINLTLIPMNWKIETDI